jgi:hypothetical protein
MNRFLSCALLSLLLAGVTGCTSAGISASGPAVEPHHGRGHGPPAHAKAHGFRRQFQYHYYPDSTCYYAPDRGLYFWIDGEDWKVGATLPDSIVISSEEHVTIALTTDTPWEQHDRVVSAHPGKTKAKASARGKSGWKGID